MSEEELAVDSETTEDQAPAEPEAELSDDEKQMAELKEAITVDTEEIGSLRLKLTVTIPEDMLDSRRSDQFAELKRDADVPGFRKGHAPLRLVERRFAADVGEQLKRQLIGGGYLAAIEKEDIKTLGDPLYWVTVEEERETDEGKPQQVQTQKLLSIEDAIENIKMPKEGPLSFSCEVELKPEFDLPELKGIPVERPDVKIDNEDVERELRRMRAWRGTYKPVEKGKIEADDALYADYKMVVEGETVASEEDTDLAARDMRLQGVPLKGLGDALVGKKLGDQVSFEATVPDDHDNIGIRGKSATFDITIREIKRLELPEIDDEFLSGIGFDSEDALRSTLRESLESRLDTTIKDALRSQVGQFLIDNTKLEIPEGLSQRQADRSIARRMIEMYQQGVPEAEIEKKTDELRASAQDQAVTDLKLYFILEKIAEDLNVEVGEDQINGAIAQMAQQSNKRFDRMRDELSKGDGLFVLYNKLRDQQVLDDLLKDAKIVETKGPIKTSDKKSSKKTAKKTVAKATSKKATQTKKATKETTKKKASKRSS